MMPMNKTSPGARNSLRKVEGSGWNQGAISHRFTSYFVSPSYRGVEIGLAQSLHRRGVL
ncbi:HTH-type transcriptional regulator [Anopheles sinensis]|uniref:HTH-type transcriptional regulator n=1 Tax=Anopheles sinensis TaxID=74873 RepID=A0A084VY99_ANOSI|nr:HTH-type transcriptional regulator [Anopheles sinensis]